MAKQHTVDVIKELGTLQLPELVDVKQEISPYSKVPSELCVGEVTESSKTNETPLKPCLEVIMEHMKTLVERVEKSQGEIEKRLKSVEEQLGKDQGVIEKHFTSVEKRLEAVESSLPKRNQGVQPDMSVNKKDIYGRTLLVNAVLSRDIANITMLLKRGADVNIADSNGWLALHWAAYKGFTEVCALLLMVGNADLNAKTTTGTALHIAAIECHIKVVELLLKFGADVNLKCSKGKTAYDYAVEKKHNEIALLLDCAFNRDMFTSSLSQPLKK